MLDWIQEGSLGDWSVEHFEINKSAALIYAIGCYGSYEVPPLPGKYTRLVHKKRGVVMSDTRQELFDLRDFTRHVKKTPSNKTVHINGLGLGIFTKVAAESCPVEVIEIDADVIELVGSQLLRMFPTNLTIIHADALEWKPPKDAHYGVVWHDIWDEITTDNWPEYNLLMRRYGRKTDWQDAWARYVLMRELRRDRYW